MKIPLFPAAVLISLLAPSLFSQGPAPGRADQDKRVAEILKIKQAAVLEGIAKGDKDRKPALSFGAPSTRIPYYYFRVYFPSHDLPQSGFLLEKILLEGREVRDLDVGARKRIWDRRIPGGEGLVILGRYDWVPGREYIVTIWGKAFSKKGEKEPTGPAVKKVLRAKIGAKIKGRPFPKWKNYLSVLLSETGGLPRRGEPVHMTLALFADQICDPRRELRVLQNLRSGGYKEVPFQVTDRGLFDDPELCANREKDKKTGKQVVRCHKTRTFDLCFQADVPPLTKSLYLILYDRADAPKPTRRFGC